MGRVGGTRPPRHHADAGPAGQLAGGFRHHGGTPFLAAHGHAHRHIMQRIQHREIAFARHAEDVGHAMHEQLIDDQLAAGARGMGHGSEGLAIGA
jgi:hypothetical protein